jgi:hypothetical protein
VRKPSAVGTAGPGPGQDGPGGTGGQAAPVPRFAFRAVLLHGGAVSLVPYDAVRPGRSPIVPDRPRAPS